MMKNTEPFQGNLKDNKATPNKSTMQEGVPDSNTEEALAYSKAEFEAMFNAISDAVLFADTERRIIKSNPAFRKLFGYTHEELYGRTTELMYAHKSDYQLQGQLRYSVPVQTLYEPYEVHYQRKDGTVFLSETSGTAVKNIDGVIIGFIAIIRDITERKHAEETQQTHLHYLESVSRVSEILGRPLDIEEMLKEIVDVIFGIFACDRSWLLYPCDLDAPFYKVPYECTRPEYPGAFNLGVEVPITDIAREVFSKALTTAGPVTFLFDLSSLSPDDEGAMFLKELSIQSQMVIAIYPKIGKPWLLGLHQCAYQRTWTAQEQTLFKDIASRIADALTEKLLRQSLRENEQHMRSLLRLSQNLEQARTYDEILQAALTAIQASIGYQNVWVYLFQEDQTYASLLTIQGDMATTVTADIPRLRIKGDPFMEEIAEATHIVVVADARTDPRTDKDIVAYLENRTIVNVPIILANRRLGALGTGSFGDEGVKIPNETQLDFLAALASHLAVVMDRVQLLATLDQRANQLAALHEIALDITTHREMTELLQAIAARAANLLRASGGMVYVLEPDDQTLTLTAVYGAPHELVGTQVTQGEDIAGYVLANNQPLIINNYSEWSGRATEAIWSSVIAVPLLSDEQVIGVLCCHETANSQRPYDEADTHMLKGLARLAALAIENAHLYLTATRRADELDVLIRLSHAISANLDLPTVLETTYQCVGELMDNDAFWIATYTPGAAYGQYLLKIDKGTHYPLDRFPIETGVGGYTIRTAHPLLLSEPYTQHKRDKFTPLRYGYSQPIQSLISVPLLIGEQVIGAMSTQSYTRNAYSETELQLLVKLAQPVAVAMENARLFAAEHAARSHTETLLAATQAISTTLDLPQVFELILSELQRVIPYDSTSVQQLTDDNHLEIIGGRGFPNLNDLMGLKFDLLSEGHPNREVMRTRIPIILNDAPAIYSKFHEKPHAQANIRSWLGVPLLFGDRLIGMLALDKQEPGFYTAEHARLAMAFATQAASAIENARLYDELRDHATRLEQRVIERTQELAQANEQLKELDQLKSKFVSDVSHELRTPITNMGLYLDLLERGNPTQRGRYITVMQEQTNRLKQLIEDILDLSRLDLTANTKTALTLVNLNTLVEQVISVHQLRAEAVGLELSFTSDVLQPVIWGERSQLMQVLTNLVINAINYTASGKITVSTYLHTERNQVCLQVADTGMGIDPEDLPHIFDRFYRGKQTGQLTIPGTGLGLAIVKEIVQHHQGNVEIVSHVGHGSIFRICFPLALDTR